jgi:hypothetical protein
MITRLELAAEGYTNVLIRRMMLLSILLHLLVYCTDNDKVIAALGQDHKTNKRSLIH